VQAVSVPAEQGKEAAAQHGNDGQPNQHDSERILSG